MSAALYGLVLAGGRSSRMGRDKATLVYHGKSQLASAVELIQGFVQRVFVSVRQDQIDDPARAAYEKIVDLRDGIGPIAGIMAAQAQHPQAAWLIVACDLPFLDTATLSHLLAHRHANKLATAFRSSHDGLPEPLCAIYEPASREPLAAHLANGKQCPRKFLMQSEVHLLDEPNPRALDNINTPAEHGSAVNALDTVSSQTQRPLKVQYFALLREQAKCREEVLASTARDPAELYEQLKARHSFSLPADMLRVAVNSEFVEWTQPLRDGDVVVFIPPVAGG